MANQKLLAQLSAAKTYFDKSTACLTEEDSEFVPVEGMLSVAHQVAHTAQTVDWFINGAFKNSRGMNLDFESLEKEVRAVTSLAAAREWLERAFSNAATIVGMQTEDVLDSPIAGQIMGGMPKRSAVGGIIEHTSHHRGALTVYARLRGKIPAMPYM